MALFFVLLDFFFCNVLFVIFAFLNERGRREQMRWIAAWRLVTGEYAENEVTQNRGQAWEKQMNGRFRLLDELETFGQKGTVKLSSMRASRQAPSHLSEPKPNQYTALSDPNSIIHPFLLERQPEIKAVHPLCDFETKSLHPKSRKSTQPSSINLSFTLDLFLIPASACSICQSQQL